jgi:hypothetical protein
MSLCDPAQVLAVEIAEDGNPDLLWEVAGKVSALHLLLDREEFELQ